VRAFVIVFLFVVAGFLIMAIGLHFRRNRVKGAGCCANGLDAREKSSDRCNTCPNSQGDIPEPAANNGQPTTRTT